MSAKHQATPKQKIPVVTVQWLNRQLLKRWLSGFFVGLIVGVGAVSFAWYVVSHSI